MKDKWKIAVVGLGYVGLPVATSFAKAGFEVAGFDVSENRIAQLQNYQDINGEVESEDLHSQKLTFTTRPNELSACNFFIITVPTPITEVNQPDLAALYSASQFVGEALSLGDCVVFESTVYPGATEEECIPVLEKTSGLKAGQDFMVGYSPERINPGDKEHRFETTLKIVAGLDAASRDAVESVYGAVVKAGLHTAPSIKTAEAAKVLENTQRDINIALINELALIFDRLDIDTNDVLDAAGTKWNFLRFSPGLVGGHCIGVDPYYLTYRAEKAGYHPEMILAGRRINSNISKWLASALVQRLVRRGTNSSIRVCILGMTFKENVADIRNTKVIDLIRGLEGYGIKVEVYDPIADPDDVKAVYNLELRGLHQITRADAVVLAVPHQSFVNAGWRLANDLLKDGKGLFFDLKGRLDRETKPDGVELWRL